MLCVKGVFKMKFDKIMIIGLVVLLLSPVAILLSINEHFVLENQYSITDYRSRGIVVENGVAYIAGDNVLEAVSIDDPNFMFQFGKIETQGDIVGLFKSGNLVYLPYETGGFTIIDVTNVLNLISVGNYSSSSTIWDIFVSGTKAYLPVADAGLDIVDVTNPSNISLVGSYHDGSNGTDRIFVEGSIAYLGEASNGLKIIDISNSSNPQLLGQYDKNIRDIFVKDNIAYLALTDGLEFSGVEIVDMEDPTDPKLLSRIEIPTYDIFVKNEFVYIPVKYEQLVVYDISKLESPRRVGQYPFPSKYPVSRGNIVFSLENRIYLCTQNLNIINQELTKLDLSDNGIRTTILVAFLGVIVILISLYRDRSEKNSIDYYLKLYKAKKAKLKHQDNIQ